MIPFMLTIAATFTIFNLTEQPGSWLKWTGLR